MPPESPKYPQGSHGNLEEKRAVPKFASFRPKIPSKPSEVEADSSKPSTSRLSGDTGPADRPAVVKRPSRKYASRTDHSKSRHEDKEKAERKSRSPPKINDKSSGHCEHNEGLFTADRLGDPKNLAFGALDRYSIPSYSRFGTGNVLGSSNDQKIDRNVSNEKSLVLSYYHPFKKVDRRSLWRANNDIRELKINAQANQPLDLDPAANYVPLTAVQRRKSRQGDHRSGSEASSFSGEENTDYRSIEGRARHDDKPIDPDLIYVSNESASGAREEARSSGLDEVIKTRRNMLLKQVEIEPTDCGAWLNLITHQNDLFRLSKSSQRTGLTDAENRSNADVKLSMYEKALEKITNREDRETLLVGMMEEATKVWEIQKLSTRWKNLLQTNPRSLTLWTKFIDFKQTSFSSFRYEEVRTLFLECLSILEHTQNAVGESIADLEATYEIQVYLLLRMTLFMRESGYSEHAAAAWQAVLEYEFFKPEFLEESEHTCGDSPRQRTLAAFEDFWDSEVPRIGENHSRGWWNFYVERGEPLEPKVETAGTLEDGRNLWSSWYELERKHGHLAGNPARTIDDVEENDPYRFVLFSDIQPFLINSPTSKGRQTLLDAFILFCQLPPRLAHDPYAFSINWRRINFLRNEALHRPCGSTQGWDVQFSERTTVALDSVDVHRDSSSATSSNLFKSPTADYQVLSDSLFAITGSWFSAFDAWQNANGRAQSPLRVVWVLNALRALVVHSVGGDSLAEYLLALELRFSPETVRRTAKGLLKKQPSNLRLYNVYALIEYRLGNPSRGENTLVTSINMGKDLDQLAQQGSILLWRTWAWELLTVGKTSETLERLAAYGDVRVPSDLPDVPQAENIASKPAVLLRTERALANTRDHMLFLGEYIHASIAMECQIIFAYLRNSQSLPAATLTFQSNLTLLSEGAHSIARECLHQSFARLLHYHATHTSLFKPSDIRALLAESMKEFPQNTIFLSLYAWNEARFRIDDRVRSIVKDVILAKDNTKGKQPESIIPHFFAVYTELHRSVTFGSNASTIRSTFERAVGSTSGMHCAGLWKLYFLFERSRGNIASAKRVFWRGVRACPWAKELYLLAFEGLREVMEDAELRSIYELMVEKELRVHVNLDDIFEEMEERNKGG